jgi:tRNA pseudouridine55 synthase
MTTGSEVASGLLVVDKPSGWTSHQVVGRVRRLLGTRKVGHAGTLDPMATGVLLVGVNRATRLLGQLSLTDKVYEATIRLGQGTVTDDADGEVSSAPGVPHLPDRRLDAALDRLRGDIVQVPSSVSAIKVGGVRSYARVRAGEAVQLAGRPVRVSRLEVRDRRDLTVEGLDCVDLDVVVECSTGTYIRALARDLGVDLGTGGHLTALRRTRVGSFGIDEAYLMDEVAEPPVVIPIAEVARRCFPTLTLDEPQEAAVRVGRRLAGLVLPAPLTALLTGKGEFLALYRVEGDDAIPEAVFV